MPHSEVAQPLFRHRSRRAALVAMVAMVGAMGASQTVSAQNLVQNPGFDNGLSSWSTSGTVDIYFNGEGGITAPAGFNYFANPWAQGTIPGEGGTLSQTVPLAKGGRYDFSFYYGVEPGQTWSLKTTIAGITVFNSSSVTNGTMQQSNSIVNLTAGPTPILFNAVLLGGSIGINGNGEFGITDVSLIYLGPNALSLQGLNANQTAIGTAVNGMLTGTIPAGFTPVTSALTNVSGQPSLAAALDQLSPEIYNKLLVEALYAGQQFSKDLMSCGSDDGSGVSVIRGGQCLWVHSSARFLTFDHTSANIGARDTTGSFSAGGQVVVGRDLKLGFGFGYDKIGLEMDSGAVSHGDRGNVGGVLKYNPGPLLLAAGITAGWGSYDTTRAISFGGLSTTATSKNDVDYVSGQLRAAYLIPQANWYLKPGVDAAVTNVDIGGFTEASVEGAALAVAGANHTVFSVSPGLEIGTQAHFDDISTWRFFARGGLTWQDTSHFLINSSFAEAPGVTPFAVNTKIDQVLADVSVGVDVINKAGAVLKFQYDGRFGDTTEQSSFSLKGGVAY